MPAAVVRCGDLDVAVLVASVSILVLDATVGEVDAVVEPRQVVRQLARATQARVEGLPRRPAALEARCLQQLAPFARERDGALVPTVDGNRFHQTRIAQAIDSSS